MVERRSILNSEYGCIESQGALLVDVCPVLVYSQILLETERRWEMS